MFLLLRALVNVIALGGIVLIAVPLLLARIDPFKGNTWTPGIIIVAFGASNLLWCARDFFVSGKGTVAPWDPPKTLVIVGLYKFVRNPIYLGDLFLVLGWSFYFTSPLLLLYVIFLGIFFHCGVIYREEPWLESQFQEQWQIYKKNVPRWLPRVKPWQQSS